MLDIWFGGLGLGLIGLMAAYVALLRKASQRGIDRFMALEQDPMLAPIRDTREFRDLIRDMAGAWLERARRRGRGTPAELRVMAHAHAARGEYARAAELLEQALAAGSPFDAVLRQELAAMRQQEQGGAAAPPPAPEETSDRPQSP